MPHHTGIWKTDQTWTNPKKIQARLDTTVFAIQQVFGKHIPKDKQYWTLCGRSTGRGTELHQVTEELKLVKPEQFYGVEVNRDIHNENILIKTDAHFICGELVQTIDQAIVQNQFNPAVVRLDLHAG